MSSLNKNNVLSEALNWDGELLADIQNALKEKLREMDANANGGVSSISLSVNGSNQLVVEVTRADGTKRAASYDVSNMIGGGGSVVMGRIVDGLFYPATKIEGGNAYADTPLTNPDTGKLYIDMTHGNIYRYNPNLSDPWDRMSNIAVDGTLSSTSTNPISNKAVTLALEDKLEAGDIAGKADKLAGMLHPAQWPKVVILNVSGNTIFQAQTGDVFFDAGILYLQTSSTETTPIGAPQEGILYYCLADNKTYYWRGNSWHQAGGSGNGTVQSVSVNGGQPQYPNGQTGNVNLIVEAGAQGPKGDTGNVQVDGNGNVLIVNSLTEGGTGAGFSAEMGKRVAGREATDRQRIDAIVAILKKSVFTDDQTAAFANLDALANGIDSISFNASSHKFTNLGDTFTLSIVTDPAGKTAQVTWATSNASVATVNNGVVTAVADGTATITATTTDGKVAVCNIEVATIHITGLSLNKSTLTLNGNDANETLIATTVPAGYESGVQWSSSDPTKATVDNNGKVTAVANTAANTPVIITASIGGQTATCQVTVTGVMQTFHISLGTLSNVTIEDGQGNAITNGQAVLEGSALAINFVPAASHEISALSVVMGSTTLGLADATDGTDGAKVISIQSVSGDITVSASATYVRTNIIANATKLTKQGVLYNSNGNFGANNDYDCFIVPLEFGKRYEVDGYDWKAKNGVAGGFNIALVKSDGNGGFTNINADTDIADSAAFNTANTMFLTTNSKVFYNFSDSDYRERFFVTIPPASVFDQSVDAVYLAINTRFSSVDISNDIRMYEYLLGSEYSADDIILNYGPLYHLGYSIGFNLQYSVSIVKAVKGATYSYGGMKWSELNGNGAGFCVALLKKIGDTEMIDNLKAADFKNGSAWLQSDSYFGEHTNNICKPSPAEAATITIPTSADLADDTDLYIAITTRFTSTDISSYITLTKQ